MNTLFLVASDTIVRCRNLFNIGGDNSEYLIFGS